MKPELKPREKLQPDGHMLALVSPWGDLEQRAGTNGCQWGQITHISTQCPPGCLAQQALTRWH